MKGYPPWLANDFEHEFRLRDRWKELHTAPASPHPVHRRGYFTLTNYFWPLVMEFEDPAWTGTPTQTRVPLLDERLLRFQLRVPPVPLCIDKQILREAMRGLLPESVRLRRKTPLAQSPLQLSMKKHSRSLEKPHALAKATERFVDASKLSGSDTTIDEEQLRSILPPLQLDRWLKSIEKSGTT
jgi:asparagine synthase (glutamine-hydrolysing)